MENQTGFIHGLKTAFVILGTLAMLGGFLGFFNDEWNKALQWNVLTYGVGLGISFFTIAAFLTIGASQIENQQKIIELLSRGKTPEE